MGNNKDKLNMIIQLPAEYPLILAGLSANFLLLMILMPVFGARNRKQAFNKEFMSQFDQEHEEAFPGTKPDALGMPDQGTGWYSKKLEFEKWVKFNSAQRLIMNYIEFMPIMIIPPLISGLFYTRATVITTWCVLLGRMMYSYGYAKNPVARFPGFIVFFLAQFTNIILAFISAFMWLSVFKSPETAAPT